MIHVTFVQPDGSAATVEARPGDSVMQAAVSHGVPGIEAECGGSMSCATCHCHVDPAWFARTGGPGDAEMDMLEFADSHVGETSRLACQIRLGDTLDGLVVHIPG